ncbi:MAG: hypothetical protein ACE5OZ_22435 [Candidatus Heimdallarchaeota archaeon]
MEINKVLKYIETRVDNEKAHFENVLSRNSLRVSQFGPLVESCKEQINQIHECMSLCSIKRKFEGLADLFIPIDFRECCTNWGLWNAWVYFESQIIGLDRISRDNREQDLERQYLAKIRNAAKAVKGIKLESFGPKLIEFISQGDFKSGLNLLEKNQNDPGMLSPVGPDHCFSNLRVTLNNKHHMSQSLGVGLFIVSYYAYPFITSRSRQKNILKFLWSHLIWNLDYHIVFIHSSRYREMLPASAVNWLYKPIEIGPGSRTLDLFGNLSLLSYFAAWFGAEECVINDVSLRQKTAILTEIRKKLLKIYLDEQKPNDHPDAEKVLGNLDTLQYCDNRPFLPVDPFFIRPKDAWTFGGLVEEIEKRKIISELQIKISQDTSSECFGSDPFDLVILDPPFGIASAYQVSEQEGKKLAEKGLSLANELLKEGGKLLFRKRSNWSEITPENENLKPVFQPRDNGQTIVGIWKK